MKPRTYNILGVVFLLVAFSGRTPGGVLVATAICATMFVLGNRKSKKLKNAPRPEDGRVHAHPVDAEKMPDSKPSASPGQQSANDVAAELRKVAASLDDLSVPFPVQFNSFHIIRGTKSTSIEGPGNVWLGLGGVHAVVKNARSNAKPREIKKAWKDAYGSTPFPNCEIFFRDGSWIEIKPATQLQSLWFPIVWKVFEHATNGGFDLFENEPRTVFARRLRGIAEHVEANPVQLARGGIDVEQIPLSHEGPAKIGKKSDYKFPSVGDIVDHWKLIKRLGGESGFGVVFLVESTKDPGFQAALKFMKPDTKVAPDSPEFHRSMTRFHEEAELSFHLSGNPFVITARGFGQDPWPWIVYPLAHGKTVIESAPIAGQSWWDLAHDLVAGLYFIHQQGIIHRDIKFDNVIVESDKAVILDFGISHVAGYEHVSNAAAAVRLTSPEMLRVILGRAELSQVTSATDIFCAGLTLYAARTGGKLPWPALPSYQTEDFVARHMALIATHPIDFAAFTTEESALLTPMLEFDPNKRPNAHELLDLIALHVDVETKIDLIEKARIEFESEFEFEEREGDSQNEFRTIDGPFADWSKFRSQVEEIVSTIKPLYFTISFTFSTSRNDFYVQALTESGGWMLECESELSTSRSQTERQKESMLRLGWNPPVAAAPNYQKDISTMDWRSVSEAFLVALEQGIGIRPDEIEKMTVNVQGRNHY